MVVLGLETVTRAGSLALDVDGVISSCTGDPSVTHGARLPSEAIDWLARSELRLADVDLFAIVAGPGSFTGLRVGMATVQGWALARARTVVPVGTLDATIEMWLARHEGVQGVLIAALDGQRGQVFAAAFDVTGARTVEQCRLLFGPTVGSPHDVAQAIGPLHDEPVVWIGTGLERHGAAIRAARPEDRIEVISGALAEAATAIAARHPDRGVAPHALRPIYVRRPDAVLARERAGRPALAESIADLEIRRAVGPDDLADVDLLQRRTFTNPWGADAIRWELENTDVARLYVIRAPGGDLVGYCACWMVFDELHINSLAIDDRWRRRGVARRLLAQVFTAAVAAGARSATLEVRQSNDAARMLYEGLGFEVEGIRRDYYQDPREDALILWNRHLAGR